MIVADKDAAATGTVSLVVQGNDGTNDWYYSVPVEGRTVVKADEIKSKCSLSTAPNLADCHIWLEITDTDGMVYANSAKAKDISLIDNVAVTGVKPVGGMAFTTASCTTTGIAITTAKITYTTKENENDVAVTDKLAAWDKTYKATFSLATGIENDVVYAFTDHVSVNIDGEGTDNTISPNADGTLTVTKEFTTLKRKIVSVTAPAVPADNTFTTYYGFDGNADSPLSTSESVSSNELGNQATVTLEGTESVQSVTEKMNVTWTVANEDGARYNKTPGAANTFRWTISKDDFTKYDASTCTGYDAQTGNLTDTIAINNKAAIPVTITGTDSSENYTGVTIDVSRYFTLDVHAGTPTYSIITGTDGGTGVGTLSGSVLTVTKTGTFKIKVNTAANGIYGAGEKIITITVANGTIAYSVTDYSGTYDGQSHSISVNVTNPEGTIISYSTDGENYGSDNPSFTKAGNYTVYYRITKDNYNTISNNSAVNVAKAASAPNKPDNTMNVDYNKKKVSDITTLSEGWAWQDADKDTALTVGTVVKATAVYTGVDKGNYAVESVEISITRAECTHATTEVKNAKDATCTEKGYTGDTCCTVCEKVITAGADINDLGHDMTKTVSAEVKATCTTDGKEAVKGCSRCDHTEGGATIDALGHKWDAGKVTKKPTETAEGVKTYTCRACGNTKKKAIPKKAATTPKPSKKGDVVNDDKASAKVKVTSVTKKAVEYMEPAGKIAKTISIPATVKINGVTYKVTKIDDNAFKNNKTVTKVTVGSNIKTIGKNAFSGATKLKTVKLGKNVTEVGANAFKGCSSLTSVTLGSKATKIGANAFSGCKKLKTIKITSTKLSSKMVAKNAFKGLTKATTIKVPKKKLSAYKKLFKQKGLSSKVKVKGY